MNRAVLLDRDGTIVKDTHYLSRAEDVRIYKGVIPALKKLKKNGWKLIIGTNQSGIGRGFFGLDALKKIHNKLHSIFAGRDLKIDAIYFCPHQPKDRCPCRKPNTGMLRKAAKKFRLDLKKCVVVGDNECDILWGKNGGTKTVLVLSGKGRRTVRSLKTKPNYVALTLPRAVEWILKNEH